MQQSNRDRALLEARTSKRPPGSSVRGRVEQLVASRVSVALFLDVDGPLLDVALTPSTVHVPLDVSALLASVSAGLFGAIAIVTGRPIREADRLLKPLKFAAAGVHGAEMRLTANGEIVSLTPYFDAGLAADLKLIAQDLPGIVMEDKGAGIALHYRSAPELHSSLLNALEALIPKYHGQFEICQGRKVVEVLPVGVSKGWALRQLATLPEFVHRTPVMIGDDVSDLEAFRAAEDLGGYGLKVAGENFSSAEASFRGPSEVLDWLKLFRAGP
jgi:trehalose 6-phosphate phosphatase